MNWTFDLTLLVIVRITMANLLDVSSRGDEGVGLLASLLPLTASFLQESGDSLIRKRLASLLATTYSSVVLLRIVCYPWQVSKLGGLGDLFFWIVVLELILLIGIWIGWIYFLWVVDLTEDAIFVWFKVSTWVLRVLALAILFVSSCAEWVLFLFLLGFAETLPLSRVWQN